MTARDWKVRHHGWAFLGSVLLLAAVSQGAPSVKNPLGLSANPTPRDFLRARAFPEPLVPVGRKPTATENAALAAALRACAQRQRPDDFSSLAAFVAANPSSPWVASLLTNLGQEYYRTAQYSLALAACRQAWSHANEARDANAMATVNRAAGELAHLYARLGRMTELEALLKSVEGRTFIGGPRQSINGARDALWMMQNHPEVSFRCGPLALESIRHSLDPQAPIPAAIFNSASTQQGFSLPQVAALSREVGLNYQMAFRKPGGAFIVPSVVHWKVGHYAAIVRRVGDRYLVEDPTFGNTAWPTKETLEAESSGYFLVPPGKLPPGWRSVDAQEGERVWGKGVTYANDPDDYTCSDLQTAPCNSSDCTGMAISSVHLMLANLQIRDTPVRYAPPVGPPVRFTIRYNHRERYQSGIFIQSNFGFNWTCDWFCRLADQSDNPMADVRYFVGGGGARTFTGFDTNTQTFAYQQYDQTLLRRTGTNGYEMVFPDGSKRVFGLVETFADSTSRIIYLTQIVDAQGNAVTLDYDGNFDLVAVTDALGQVTTLTTSLLDTTYQGQEVVDSLKITKVTDPFGRSAIFDYSPTTIYYLTNIVNGQEQITPVYGFRLSKITDEIGLTSQPGYAGDGFFVNSLTTPYGTSTFDVGQNNNTRWVETHYPDGSRDRVEYNQSPSLGIPASEPIATLPSGMRTGNVWLYARNTYYWDRNACALAYGDYTKARIYHWLHTADLSSTSGILESTKKPLEQREWYDYAGQSSSLVVGRSDKPTHVGRVLDDGSTRLYSYGYNGFGNLTNLVDPVGRTFSYIYDTNGIDLLEIRMTRAGQNQLLARMTYNSQHRPLSWTDAAGQTTTYTYNARGQLLTKTDPKHQTTTLTYDSNGYLLAVDGPLPGTNDRISATYDALGRTRTLTGVSGYTVTFDYDNLDRVTRVTHPDGTFEQIVYDRLEPASYRDRAGRQTLFEYDNMRQLVKKIDPLGRTTLFQWCRCGALKSLTDPMGRTTTWSRDVESRLTGKTFGDGSRLTYGYEDTTSRLRWLNDEQSQVQLFAYNLDNTLRSVIYFNALHPTPTVSYTYDPDYKRLGSMTDGTGTTVYQYVPVTSTPTLGAGRLASVEGPLPNDTITYGYDELGRRISSTLNGVGRRLTFDAAGRIMAETNALGSFSYGYDGASLRVLSRSFPNGQTDTRTYDDARHDFDLQQITYQLGATPLSQFVYGYNVPANRVTTWSQQDGAQPPSVSSFGYDADDELTSATVTNAGALIDSYAYGYDPAGNRVTEHVDGADYTATYNALNQLSTSSAPGSSRTNEWDAAHRLVAVNAGDHRTEFSYDGANRLRGIRQLVNGVEVSHRLFVWDGGRMREERDPNGAVTKRFFPQGVQIVVGTNAGVYFYTRDHLGSIREMTDSGGNLRARYAYGPFGRQTKVSGDLKADFGFAGMFWTAEARLCLTHFRAYDPELGRWLSRDPLSNAELHQGPNLYAYVGNQPVSKRDPQGLSSTLPGVGGTLAIELAGAAATDPGGVKDFLMEIGEGASGLVNQGVAEAAGCGAAESGGRNFLEQVTQLTGESVSTPVDALAKTLVADTLPGPPGMGGMQYVFESLQDIYPWEWDNVQGMLGISQRLHGLEYWDYLEPFEMKQLWMEALNAWKAGDLEQFFADIE